MSANIYTLSQKTYVCTCAHVRKSLCCVCARCVYMCICQYMRTWIFEARMYTNLEKHACKQIWRNMLYYPPRGPESESESQARSVSGRPSEFIFSHHFCHRMVGWKPFFCLDSKRTAPRIQVQFFKHVRILEMRCVYMCMPIYAHMDFWSRHVYKFREARMYTNLEKCAILVQFFKHVSIHVCTHAHPRSHTHTHTLHNTLYVSIHTHIHK
jgi:hypothetical protein